MNYQHLEDAGYKKSLFSRTPLGRAGEPKEVASLVAFCVYLQLHILLVRPFVLMEVSLSMVSHISDRLESYLCVCFLIICLCK